MSTSSDSRSLLYPRRLTSGQRQIRVLSFETGKDQNEAIHLTMVDISLDGGETGRRTTYNALSYTWGNPTPEAGRKNPWITEYPPPFDYTTRSIYVNDQKLDVTANLFFALKRLYPLFKYELRVPYLWVDAICINQGDLIERAEQVKLMGDIYRNAEDVLVWLGEEEGGTDSEMAVDLLNNVYYSFVQWGDNDEEAQNLFEHMERERENLKWETRIASTGVPLDEANNIIAHMLRLQELWIQRGGLYSLDVRCDARAWAAVERLVGRAWFIRLWTYQEKALATSATILVGGKSISWINAHTTMSLVSTHDNNEDKTQLLSKGTGRRFFESTQPSEAGVLGRK